MMSSILIPPLGRLRSTVSGMPLMESGRACWAAAAAAAIFGTRCARRTTDRYIVGWLLALSEQRLVFLCSTQVLLVCVCVLLAKRRSRARSRTVSWPRTGLLCCQQENMPEQPGFNPTQRGQHPGNAQEHSVHIFQLFALQHFALIKIAACDVPHAVDSGVPNDSLRPEEKILVLESSMSHWIYHERQVLAVANTRNICAV